MTQIDDGAMVFIGTAAYDCCKPGSTPEGSADDSLLFAYKAWNKQPDVTSVWVYFEEGSYYPIRIVYVNVLTAGGIGLQVTPPNGSPVDVGSLVYQLENNDETVCKATTITNSYSTATTFVINEYDETTRFIPTETVVGGVTQTVVLEQVYYTQLASTITSVTYGSSEFTSTYYTNTIMGTTTGVAEVIVIGKPDMQRITYRANVDYSVTVTMQTVKTSNGVATTSQYVYVQIPQLKTNYVAADVTTITTTTSVFTSTINGNPTETSLVQVFVPTPFTRYTYYTGSEPTTYITPSGTTYIEIVANPRPTSINSWGEASWQTYTTTYETTVDGKDTSIEMVVENVPSVTTVYQTGTDQNTYTATATKVTTDQNIVRSYLEITVLLPHPVTSISVGAVETTYLTTNDATYYVVERSSFPTVTTFVDNIQSVYTTYTPVVIDASTDWEYVVVYPQPSTQITEWTGLYTQYITSTIYTDTTKIEGFKIIEKVPRYSTSISEWGGTGIKTVTEVGLVTNKLGIISTSTYKVVYRPSLSAETTTWVRPDTSTEYTDTTIFPSNGFPITTSIELVYIPGKDIIRSWTTTTIPGPCTTSSTSTTSYTTAVNGTPTVIGVIYYNGPSPACFLPPPVATTVTVTKPATDCASHTVSSTTQLTGLDGAVTTSVDVIVELPSIACFNTATTVTTTKTAADCASHIASSTTQLTGLDGAVTTSVDVIVELPSIACFNTATTVTTTKTAADCASHIASSTTQLTGLDGAVTTSVDVIVELPSIACFNTATTVTTTKTAADCASHIASSTTQLTGLDGAVTTSVDVIVELPSIACFNTATTVTTTKTAADCATHTASSTTQRTGSNGIITTLVNVIIQTPAGCFSASTSSNRFSTAPSSADPNAVTGTVSTSASSLAPSNRFSTSPSSADPNVDTSASSAPVSSLAPSNMLTTGSSSADPNAVTDTVSTSASSLAPSNMLTTGSSSADPNAVTDTVSTSASALAPSNMLTTGSSSADPNAVTDTVSTSASSLAPSNRLTTGSSSADPNAVTDTVSTSASALAPSNMLTTGSSSADPNAVTDTVSTSASALAPSNMLTTGSSSADPNAVTDTVSTSASALAPSNMLTTGSSSADPNAVTDTVSTSASALAPSNMLTTGSSSTDPNAVTDTVSTSASSLAPSNMLTTGSSSADPNAVTDTVSTSASALAPSNMLTTGSSSTDPNAVTDTVSTSVPSLASSNELSAVTSSHNPELAPTSTSGAYGLTTSSIDFSTTVTSYRPANDCANHTTTSVITITDVKGSIETSVNIIIETVPLSCRVQTSSFTPTTTITSIITSQLNDCNIVPAADAFTNYITGNDVVTVLVETTAIIPNPTCNIIFTTEPADGCYSSSYMTYVGTRNIQGMYVNATLVVVETMPQSCLITTDLSGTAILSSQPSTSIVEVTSTTGLPSSVLPAGSLSFTNSASTTSERASTEAVSTTSFSTIVPLITTATPVTNGLPSLTSPLSLDSSTSPSEPFVSSSVPTTDTFRGALPNEGTTGETVTDSTSSYVPSQPTFTLPTEASKAFTEPINGGEQLTTTDPQPLSLPTAGLPNSPITGSATDTQQIPTEGLPGDFSQTDISSPYPSQTSTSSLSSPQTSGMPSLSIYAGSGLKIHPTVFGTFFSVILSVFVL